MAYSRRQAKLRIELILRQMEAEKVVRSLHHSGLDERLTGRAVWGGEIRGTDKDARDVIWLSALRNGIDPAMAGLFADRVCGALDATGIFPFKSE